MFRGLYKFIFFGNIFYGVCSVALSIEASIQQDIPLNDALFYLIVFAVVVWYYSIAYITEKPAPSTNRRTVWYNKNLALMKWFQRTLFIILIISGSFFLYKYLPRLLHLSRSVWVVVVTGLLASGLYYGINHRAIRKYNLRQIGWLKPFTIGFCWAMLVTPFPVIYHSIQTGEEYTISLFSIVLFIKNFMFISLLCILFDIKDYASDYNLDLKTFVVEMGLRKTIFLIIIPLTLVGWGSFLAWGFTHGFSAMKIILNTIPFLLLILVAWSLHRRRSIIYYLVIIDGLMLIKAICGITAMFFF